MIGACAGTVTERAVVHQLYGIRIRTPWRVRGLETVDGPWDVEFVHGDRAQLADAASYVPPAQQGRWAESAALPDGSHYRRWNGLFEFVVTPDARQIQARVEREVEDEALLAYLLVDALSFSMIRLGWEPLHATAVQTDDGVAAFLGESGRGKSTLAAGFVRAGSRLLTDDMLILTRGNNRFLAQPGPPRIKLYREMAMQIFGAADAGVPMNSVTEKLILPLTSQQTATTSAALTALYILDDAPAVGSPLTIRRIAPAQALPAALAATAGHFPFEADRLTRQFAFVTTLVQTVPMMIVTYPRGAAEIGRVREAILADMRRLTS
jgi:hypothetical protein